MPTESNRPPRHDQRLIGNRIGENNADNEFSSSAVAANADGSIFERLEAIKDQITTADAAVDTVDGIVDSILGSSPAAYNPHYGFLVTKTGDIAAAPDALFDVTGLCLVTLMVGEVSSVLATSSSMSLNTSTNNQVIVASTQITSDALGTLYLVSGDVGLGFNAGAAIGVDAAVLDVGTTAPFLMNDDQIEQNVNSAGTGTIDWSLWYWPLEASAAIAAAS